MPLAAGSAPLRYGDGTATGFTLTGDELSFDDGSCPPGGARLDLHELIPSAAGPLAFHRGGSGYADRGNVKYGELAVADLGAPLRAPVPSSGGRGAPCALAAEPPYQVAVRSITSRMHYKSTGGASYVPYGDPAADQGSNDGSVHYSYLLWSFVNVAGGGTVRTLLPEGQIVRACDVDPITLSSYDSAGAVNGQVTARYVRTLAGSCPVYGWMVWSHTYYGNRTGAIAHASVAASVPPPDPVPDPACPVAAAPSPPTVATGEAVGRGTTTTLTGSINPKGVPTVYHFDFGPTAAYGASTAPATLSPAPDQPLSAAGRVRALLPGMTIHYRLVAANTHGFTFGADRTLAPTNLSSLKIRPGAFRRGRDRRAAPAHIVFRLSSAATVTLTFERKLAGVRRGSACRPAPAGGIPRHARRCTRLAAVRGSLRRTAPMGRVSIPFGGWVGARRLAPGRYAAIAVAAGASGPPGLPRAASFTVR